MLYEAQALQKIDDHKNVIKFIEHGKKTYKKLDGKVRENVDVFVFELISGGQLFDYIKNNDASFFSEKVARYFFKQLIEGLDHCF